MSNLKTIRERQNLTQEEVAEQSGISVRTIQRIEAGTAPKGHTLRALAKALAVEEKELLAGAISIEQESTTDELAGDSEAPAPIRYPAVKLINLSSILFILLPPLNILVPLLLMFGMKQKNELVRQIISVQILWTITAPIVFMLGIFLKLGRTFTLLLIIAIVLSNVGIILRNAIAIDRKKQLFIRLNFSMI